MIPRESKPPRDYEATDEFIIRVKQGTESVHISGKDIPEGRTVDAKRFFEQLLFNLEKKLDEAALLEGLEAKSETQARSVTEGKLPNCSGEPSERESPTSTPSRVIGTFDLDDFTSDLDSWALEIQALFPNGSYLPVFVLQAGAFFHSDSYFPS